MSQMLEPAGITPQQYNVLRILRGAEPTGLPTLEIADRMIEQAPGITRLLDRLEAKKLAGRERCPTDRRQVTCRITRKGIELLAELDPVMDQADNLVLRGLSAAEVQDIIRLLDALRGALSESR